MKTIDEWVREEGVTPDDVRSLRNEAFDAAIEAINYRKDGPLHSGWTGGMALAIEVIQGLKEAE